MTFGLGIVLALSAPGVGAQEHTTQSPTVRNSLPQTTDTGDHTPTPASSGAPAQEQEFQALRLAVSSASPGNPQSLINSLKGFLAQYPASSQRKQVLKFIMNKAMETNDPETALVYGEKQLDLDAGDFEILSSVAGLLDGKTDPASEAEAIRYISRFIEQADKMGTNAPRPGITSAKWAEEVTMVRAAAYAMRAKVYANSLQSGSDEKALSDYRMSYAEYPVAPVAERLGDIESKSGSLDAAINDYATAFAFPLERVDPEHREQLRRKLGSVYIARYQSEKGLGDLVMSRYDELLNSLSSRFDSATPAAVFRNALDSTIDRLDGSKLRLADFRGKVVVVDFWATWCGPCRVAGELMERVAANLKDQTDAVFLAINTDENRENVPAFVERQRWKIPVAYSSGLDRTFAVHSLPTFLIFDRNSKVVYRQDGVDPETFVSTMESKIKEAAAHIDKANASTEK